MAYIGKWQKFRHKTNTQAHIAPYPSPTPSRLTINEKNKVNMTQIWCDIWTNHSGVHCGIEKMENSGRDKKMWVYPWNNYFMHSLLLLHIGTCILINLIIWLFLNILEHPKENIVPSWAAIRVRRKLGLINWIRWGPTMPGPIFIRRRWSLPRTLWKWMNCK